MRDTPAFDVVIPVHDNLPWLRMCLTALHAYTRLPYRVWIVDNASKTPEMRAFLQDWSSWIEERQELPPHGDMRLLRLATNESFSASVNAGVAAGSAPNVVILNSDALVCEGWDAAFLQDLAHDDVGLTGARCSPSTCAGVQQDANLSALHAAPSLMMEVQGRDLDAPTAPYLIFFCVALRRAVWNELGPLDGKTCRGWGGGEDLDYSWRAIDAGYRCVVSRAAAVHGCSKTYAARGVQAEQKAALEAKNVEALITKHGLERVQRGSRLGLAVLVASFHRGESSLIKFQESFASALVGCQAAGIAASVIQAKRTVIDAARNQLVDIFLGVCSRPHGAVKPTLDYLVMCDDDHTFGRDAIVRLVSSGKPVIAAWAYRRSVHYDDPTRADHASCVFRWGDPKDPKKGCVAMEGLEGTGLHEVDAVGHGLVAIRRDVLEALTKKHGKRLYEFAELGEDVGFCLKAHEAGFSVWVDSDLVIGHVAEGAVIDAAWAKKWRAQVAAAGGPKRA